MFWCRRNPDERPPVDNELWATVIGVVIMAILTAIAVRFLAGPHQGAGRPPEPQTTE